MSRQGSFCPDAKIKNFLRMVIAYGIRDLERGTSARQAHSADFRPDLRENDASAQSFKEQFGHGPRPVVD